MNYRRHRKNGLVFKQQSDSDKRISYIYLTEKGTLLKKAETNALMRMENRIKDNLSQQELKNLVHILGKVDTSEPS